MGARGRIGGLEADVEANAEVIRPLLEELPVREGAVVVLREEGQRAASRTARELQAGDGT